MLSVVRADRLKDCTLVKCKFNDAFQSKDAKSALQKYPHDKSVQKDTFILPAGSAVATRIKTGGPGLWFVHCKCAVPSERGHVQQVLFSLFACMFIFS